ncbi:roadblock/LC7 domain-containing protein [Deinococcus sp. SL84]|uniref:roadblock/LC7 domain-containing protein n=1 Tax=Deinococcus sp. SL84 TaxID=2994663 RepID=UPI0022746B19|nr:roadblock/LC7 domain-containing protein [Deinococcus sp. SL84]MCY1702965.1 roadblock/LC7 domain-containing protein [Deinococcus sp. SL84]
MPDTEMLTPYQLASSALESTAQERGISVVALQQVLDRILQEQGLDTEQLSAEQLQVLLFPVLDRAYADLLEEDERRRMLRGLSEQLVAQELGAVFAPAAAAPALTDSALTDSAQADSVLAGPAQPAEEGEEDWDFGEDEFEFEDPEYLAAPAARAYDLSQHADQNRLIADLGRVSGVQSVMVCRENGEVVQVRSLKDLSALGGVVAATVLLLRGRSLRLMSAQVGGTVVCVRPLGSYAVAVLAGPEVNVGRLLSELGQVQAENAA